MFKIITATVVAASLVASPALARGHHHHHRGHHSSRNVQAIATSIAQQEGVSPALVRAIMHVESTNNCSAHSWANARGAMQVKPATAASVGVHGNLYDCATGIRAGVRYIHLALRLNHGNICAAASGYNMGVGVRGRCTGYGRKVMAHMGRVHYASLR